MPLSSGSGGPPRRPIDEPTLRRALGGDRPCMKQVIGVVGHVVARVVAARSSNVQAPRRAEQTARHLLGAWHCLAEDGFAILGQWSASSSISFEQHIADAVGTWLTGTPEPDAGRRPSSEWTPSTVGAALDDRHHLGRHLARYVDEHLRACASLTLQSHRQKLDVAAEAQDLAQGFAIKLFDRDGAILRGWQPPRGRTTLRSYLYLIGRRHFIHRLRHEQRKHGKDVPIDDEHALISVSSAAEDQAAADLRRDLAFQAMQAELDDDDRELLALVVAGASAKEGAEALGITVNNFHQRKHRLLKKMKAILSRFGDRHGE
jgi:RNA polymerase sigma factor (sigma-70 family)